MKLLLLAALSLCALAVAATRTTPLTNDKAVAYEETLRAGETEAASSALPSLTVFLTDGVVQRTPDGGTPMTATVKRGDVLFRAARDGRLTARGEKELSFVRVEFISPESKEMWGATGLSPNYQVVVENGFTRTYDIRIPAHTSEPRHTHHDRVVVCLSGAQLRHVLDNGHEENSTLKTGDVLWRRAQTHVGKNLGATDLWVIAIEPK